MSSSTPFRDIFDVFELKDQPEVLRNLKNYVKFLVYDLFDPSYTYRRQTLDLQQGLLQKTCEKFPYLFVGATRDARIRAIRDFAMNRFRYRQLVFRRENESKSRRVKEPQPPRLHSPQPPLAQDVGMENDFNSSTQRVQTRESVPTIRSGRSEPLTNVSTPALSSAAGDVLPLEIPCNPPSSAASTQINAAPICRTDEVATFLSSCIPNMKYLLDSFIACGIVNREYLRIIAKWPDNRIKRFLRKFSSSKISGNIVLTDIDIYILAVHFKRYFAQSIEDGR